MALLSKDQAALVLKKNEENIVRKANENKTLTATEMAVLRARTEEDDGTELVTVFSLHKKTGLDRATIRKRLVGIEPFKREGQKKFFRLRDVIGVLHGDITKATSKGGEDRQSLECQKLLKQIERLTFQLERERGLVVDRSEVRREWLHHCSQIRQSLLALPDELAPALAGRSAVEIQKHISGVVDRMLVSLRESSLSDEAAE